MKNSHLDLGTTLCNPRILVFFHSAYPLITGSAVLRIVDMDGQFLTASNLTFEAEFSILNDSRVRYYGEWYAGSSPNPFLADFLPLANAKDGIYVTALSAAQREGINITGGVSIVH